MVAGSERNRRGGGRKPRARGVLVEQPSKGVDLVDLVASAIDFPR